MGVFVNPRPTLLRSPSRHNGGDNLQANPEPRRTHLRAEVAPGFPETPVDRQVEVSEVGQVEVPTLCGCDPAPVTVTVWPAPLQVGLDPIEYTRASKGHSVPEMPAERILVRGEQQGVRVDHSS